MNVKHVVVMIVTLAILVMGMAAPKPAAAATGQTLTIAGAATAAYIGFIVIGAALTNQTGSFSFLPQRTDDSPKQKKSPSRFRLGRRCPPARGTLTLICW